MFTKNDTWLMKGFAIIFLYCYHCFSDVSRLSGVNVDFFPFQKEMGIYICESLNMCVGMFAFLSIYGMTLVIKKSNHEMKMTTKEKVNFVLGRYIGLIGGFFIPFVFCQIVSVFFDYNPYGQGVVNQIGNRIIDMFGFSMFFKTTMLTTTWWYVSLAVLFIIVFPLILDLYKKYSIVIIPMIGLILLLFIKDIDNMNRWLFVLPLGICFADLEIFEKVYMWMRKSKKTKWVKRLILYVLFLVLVYIRPHTWGLQHLTLLINSIIPVFMICILYDIFHDKEHMKQVFVFLGKHSGDMFYVHTFIRGIWLNKLTYSFKSAILILLFLLIVTLAISIVLDFIRMKLRWKEKIMYVKQKSETLVEIYL